MRQRFSKAINSLPATQSKRSTFGRDALNLAALKDMTEGDADNPRTFWESADKFGFTFNWGYANREDIAFYSSGLLPRRAEGLDRRLPTLGTGEAVAFGEGVAESCV